MFFTRRYSEYILKSNTTLKILNHHTPYLSFYAFRDSLYFNLKHRSSPLKIQKTPSPFKEILFKKRRKSVSNFISTQHTRE